jgi:hypothetical protein
MSDAGPPHSATPIEKNGRALVEVLVQHFPSGGTSEELRRQFEKDTSLVAPLSFYSALKFGKNQGWIVGGGRDQPYTLASDGSWREPIPSIRETLEKEALEKDRLEYLVDSKAQQIEELQGEVERLRDWSNGNDADGANVAVASLIRVVSDTAATMRQRLNAASAILGYKLSDDDVADFTKRFLQAVCTSTDIATDYRVTAAELLRKCEAPRIMPPVERPPPRIDPNAEKPEPLAQLVARRRERQDRMEREEALQLKEAADSRQDQRQNSLNGFADNSE